MKQLLINKEGPVATVTLNRPAKGNALSYAMMEQLIQAAEDFRADTETRVIVFTGAGKHFCCGVDISDPGVIQTAGGQLLQRQRRYDVGRRLIRTILEINQITIGALHGLALGGGACIAAALDFRIGASNCRVGFPESNLGIPLSWQSLPLCVRLIGPSRTKRMVILGRKESAQTLLEWGFFDELVNRADLLAGAEKMAIDYAAKAPIAAQMIKKSVNAVSSAMDAAIMHMDGDQVLLAQTTADFQEGVNAVLEKRDPVYTGS